MSLGDQDSEQGSRHASGTKSQRSARAREVDEGIAADLREGSYNVEYTNLTIWTCYDGLQRQLPLKEDKITSESPPMAMH
jgi:hypothetical protein